MRMRMRCAKKATLGITMSYAWFVVWIFAGFAPQVAIIIMQRDELRVVCCNGWSRVRRSAERLAARPVDTFTNDEQNVIGTSDLSGKSIPPWSLSRLARHNVSRFFGADNERDQNTLSDLFSANAFTNRFLMQIPISRGETRVYELC